MVRAVLNIMPASPEYHETVLPLSRCRSENAGFSWAGAQCITGTWAPEAHTSRVCRPAGL